MIDQLLQGGTREHRKGSRLNRGAGGKTRFTVDHRHFTQGLARKHDSNALDHLVLVFLGDVNLAVNDEHHEIAAFTFGDDHRVRRRPVDLQKWAEHAQVFNSEIVKQGVVRCDFTNFCSERLAIAKRFKFREQRIGIHATLLPRPGFHDASLCVSNRAVNQAVKPAPMPAPPVSRRWPPAKHKSCASSAPAPSGHAGASPNTCRPPAPATGRASRSPAPT